MFIHKIQYFNASGNSLIHIFIVRLKWPKTKYTEILFYMWINVNVKKKKVNRRPARMDFIWISVFGGIFHQSTLAYQQTHTHLYIHINVKRIR